tara:strand:- start:172 stop:468 length:297 start_codon:yes stop_codon:yes gene_type:complete
MKIKKKRFKQYLAVIYRYIYRYLQACIGDDKAKATTLQAALWCDVNKVVALSEQTFVRSLMSNKNYPAGSTAKRLGNKGVGLLRLITYGMEKCFFLYG